VRKTATEQGVSKLTIDKAFFELKLRPSAIASDKAQAEFNQNFWHYVNKRVSSVRLNNGKDTLKKNASLLTKASEKYGVPAYVIVAFLGLESNYGNYMGSESLIRSLATLAYDQRRSKFFTRELIAVLKLMDKKTIPFDATGSWAGAMGAVQFMPTNVIAYGVDANNDGKVDLWNEKADIYASAANFLNKLGWKKGEKWGREALIPKNFNYQLTGLNNEKTVNEWAALGVRRGNNSNLPKSNFKASLIVPMGHKGPAFLVYRNFNAIMGWNRSILYALSVAYLSDRLNGNAKLSAKTIDEPLLSKEDIMQIQNTLNLLGYDTGTPDGMAGTKTRQATRKFQSDIGLTADGYVGYELFQQLQ
jgi:membrane-bound lytic murein transglycosylase B